MTKTNGLGTMSYAQLLELRDRVDAALEAARATEKRELRAKMESLAAKAGLTLADVLSTAGRPNSSKLKGTKVPAKYRNPKDATQTWSGRGRQPNWLVAALKKGQKLESFRA
jgi:DNA-binding protein H-NS